MKTTRIFLLSIYMLLLAVVPGCWDYTEYEDLAQLIGMGFDYNAATGETTVTIQYPSIKKTSGGGTKAGGGTDPQWVVHAATDQTIFSALTKLQEIIPQRLFYGYVKVLVVGEEAAKSDIMNMVDLFERTPVMRTSAFIVVTEGRAEDVLKIINPTRMASAEEIYKLVSMSKKTATAYSVTLNDFTQMLAIGGWEAALPRVIHVTPRKPPAPGPDTRNMQQESQGAEQSQEQRVKGGTQGNINFHEEEIGALRISGMAVFQGDKLVGWMDDAETRGYNWIRNHRIQAYKTSVPAGGPDAEEIYYRVLHAKSKIKVHLANDRPAISVHVKIVADIRKYYRHAGADFLLAQEIKEAEKRLSDSVRADIDAALRKGQQTLKSDIFGFGFALFRKDPKLWEHVYGPKWTEIFPGIPVQVTVDTKVINSGTTIRKLFVK